MVAIPILYTASDSREIISGARSLAMHIAPTSGAQPSVRNFATNLQKQTGLKTLRLDANYAPVPTSGKAATQVMTMAPTANIIGSTAYVVRGTIDDSEVDSAKAVADPRIGVSLTGC